MGWFFNILLFLVALLYATVGHGGATSYLAIFALSGRVSSEEMRASALVLNLFVSLLAFLGYRQQNHFDSRTFGLLIITSVPAAFLGGLLSLPADLYKNVLGIILLLVVLKLTGVIGKESTNLKTMPLAGGLLAGAVLGFVSGVIGIGGGIILSPLILLMGWAPVKTTAGVSAAFIFVNSASGLTGLFFSEQLVLHSDIPWWICFVVVGGLIGTWLGSRLFSQSVVRFALAVVLTVAGLKLIVIG